MKQNVIKKNLFSQLKKTDFHNKKTEIFCENK